MSNIWYSNTPLRAHEGCVSGWGFGSRGKAWTGWGEATQCFLYNTESKGTILREGELRNHPAWQVRYKERVKFKVKEGLSPSHNLEIGRDIDRSANLQREWGLEKAKWCLSSSIKGACLAQALDVGCWQTIHFPLNEMAVLLFRMLKKGRFSRLPIPQSHKTDFHIAWQLYSELAS